MGLPDWLAYPTYNGTGIIMRTSGALNTLRDAQPALAAAPPPPRVNYFNRRLQQEVEASTAGVVSFLF